MTAPPLAGTVLVVDDEPTVREVVAAYLDREGFDVIEAADGASALRLIDEAAPDLIVLDVMLPEIDGLTILRALRPALTTPVILLSAKTDEGDRVLGLELGADDYVTKPFSPREIVARVKAVLKRGVDRPEIGDELAFGELLINGATREVWLDGREIDLTPREFDLMHFLASSPRQVFSRGQLLDHVWGSSAEWQDPATVTVHIGRLRQKLESEAMEPRWITTVWGVGYRFEP